MSRIRGKDTTPEKIARSLLHKMGLPLPLARENSERIWNSETQEMAGFSAFGFMLSKFVGGAFPVRRQQPSGLTRRRRAPLKISADF